MDYEKKYNEALKRAKAAIDIAADKDLVKGVASTIFPELRESEDERIRKDILRFLKAKIENCTSPTPAKSTLSMWIAYLEKQKEQKPDIEICPHSIKGKSYKETGYPSVTKFVYNKSDEAFIRDCANILIANDYATSAERLLSMFEQKAVALDDETMDNLDRALCIVKDARGKLPAYQSDDGIYECDKAIVALEHILYNGLEKTEEPQDYSGLTDFERAIHRGFLCAGVENVPVEIIKETAKECLGEIKFRSVEEARKACEPDYVILKKEDYERLQKSGEHISVRDEFDLDGNPKQKPAKWHPEDEQNLNVCLSYIKDEPLRSWLIGAIHVRYDKPAEWSEEDESMLWNIISIVGHCKSVQADSMLDWLKSLRPRPSWKPSEEQMKALFLCIPKSGQPCTLQSLYNDLKKL